MYRIRKKQNYLSKDYNVELRCEKIIQIKGCEKFENDRQNDRKNDRRSRSDRDHFFCTKWSWSDRGSHFSKWSTIWSGITKTVIGPSSDIHMLNWGRGWQRGDKYQIPLSPDPIKCMQGRWNRFILGREAKKNPPFLTKIIKKFAFLTSEFRLSLSFKASLSSSQLPSPWIYE